MNKRLYILIYLNKQWLPCGLLEYHEDGQRSSSIFRYGKKYLLHKDAISIDPVQLPLEDHSFETPAGFSIFNGIRDAGPDKWGRYLLDKKLSQALSEIDYITETSADRAGALAFTESLDTNTTHIPPPKRLNLIQCAGAIEDIAASEDSDRLKHYLDYGPSLGGVRPKATVVWKNKLCLAKFSLSLDSKNEPRIEYATMTLAKKCGLNVPPLYLEEINQRSVFLIERFDRAEDVPIPFISGLTITGTHESDYASWSYLSLADAIIKFSENPEKDLKELFHRLIFNIAVYNNDDHLRNFGFLGSEKHWNLSPLYDVSPAVIHTNTYTLAMTLGTEGRQASYKNALSLCERFRITKKKAFQIVREIQDTTSKWKKHFKDIGVSKSEITMLENSFKSKG